MNRCNNVSLVLVGLFVSTPIGCSAVPLTDNADDSETDDGDGDSDSDSDSGGDGDPGDGDGDGDPGDGDGDGDVGVAQLRLFQQTGQDGYLFLDDEVEPLAYLDGNLPLEYLDIPAGPHEVRYVSAADFADELLGPFELQPDNRYTLVLFEVNIETDDWSVQFELVHDDDEGIAPDVTRLQFAHVADSSMGWNHHRFGLDFDVLSNDQPPIVLIDDLQYRSTATVEIPAGPTVIHFTPHDTLVGRFAYPLPDFGGGKLVTIYTDNHMAWGGELRIWSVLEDGTAYTTSYDAYNEGECGDGQAMGYEDCDGDQFYGLTCESYGYGGGSLGCSDEDGWCDVTLDNCTP